MPDPQKPCLVIAPIGDPETDVRRRSDDVLEYVIRPALEPLGYAPERADEISEPGNITSQVIQRLIDDPLVVADLTGRNPNVFYELAVRHATKQPLIQLIQRGESIPFDVAVMRTISVDLTARGAQEAITAIREQESAIRAKGGSGWTNPISGAIDLQKLNRSEKPEDRSIAAILEGVSELKSMVNEVRKQTEEPRFQERREERRDDTWRNAAEHRYVGLRNCGVRPAKALEQTLEVVPCVSPALVRNFCEVVEMNFKKSAEMGRDPRAS